MKILVVDVGGTSIKVLLTGQRTPLKIPSGPTMTPARMVKLVRRATRGWTYDAVSIGYPGPVKRRVRGQGSVQEIRKEEMEATCR